VPVEAAVEEGVEGPAGEVDRTREVRTVVGVDEDEGVDVHMGDGLHVKRGGGPGDRGLERGGQIHGRRRREERGVDGGGIRRRRGRGGGDRGRTHV
jgi:hypothetical protein